MTIRTDDVCKLSFNLDVQALFFMTSMPRVPAQLQRHYVTIDAERSAMLDEPCIVLSADDRLDWQRHNDGAVAAINVEGEAGS